MEQLNNSQIESAIFTAETFIRQHSPDVVTFETYALEQVAKIEAGERTWLVRNVDTDGRVYDLHAGTKGIAATVMLDSGEFGSQECPVYVLDEAMQDEYSLRLEEVRSEFKARGFSNNKIERLVLAEALKLAAEHADRIDN